MLAHVGRDGVHVDVAQAEHQAGRLNAAVLVALLQSRRPALAATNASAVASIVRRARIGARAADGREARRRSPRRARRAPRRRPARAAAAATPRLAHQVEQQRFVDLRIERRDRRDVVRRVGEVARASRPSRSAARRSPAAIPPTMRSVARMERHPRTDHRRGRGTAEKAVALDEHRARAGARRRQRRRAARVAAADDQDVELPPRCHARAFASRPRSTAGTAWAEARTACVVPSRTRSTTRSTPRAARTTRPKRPGCAPRSACANPGCEAAAPRRRVRDRRSPALPAQALRRSPAKTPTPTMIAIAKERLPGVPLRVGRMQDLSVSTPYDVADVPVRLDRLRRGRRGTARDDAPASPPRSGAADS